MGRGGGSDPPPPPIDQVKGAQVSENLTTESRSIESGQGKSMWLLAQNIHLFCPRGHPSDAWKSHLRGKNSKIRLAPSALKHADTTVKYKLNTGLLPLSVSVGLSHGSFKP